MSIDLTNARTLTVGKEVNFIEAEDGTYHIVVSDDGPTWNSIYQVNPVDGEVLAGGASAPIDLVARTSLFADTTFYVRTDGNDANDGLADSAEGAFLTWQAAYDTICDAYDLAGFTATIQAGGSGVRTFTSATLLATFTKSPVGDGVIHFKGDDTTPTNVVLANSGSTGVLKFAGNRTGTIYFSGFRVNGGGSSTDLIRVTGEGLVVFDNPEGTGKMSWGATTLYPHIAAREHGKIEVRADEDFDTAFGRHIEAVGTGSIVYAPRSITGTGTIAIGSRYAFASRGGRIDAGSMGAWTGTFTGTGYVANDFGLIWTNGGGSSWFPSNAGGTSNTSTYF